MQLRVRSARVTPLAAWTLAASLVGCAGSIGGQSNDRAPEPGGAAAGGSPGGSGAAGSGPSACAQPRLAPAPLRRLTREEYDHTVRDLLGPALAATTRPSAKLGEDERFGAFRSNVTAPVDDLIVDQYMRTAEELAVAAAAKPDAIVACDRKTLGDAECGKRFVDAFGLRAYRRPLTTDERDRYRALWAEASATDGFAGGVEAVVRTALESPHFLYHVEDAPAAADGALADVPPYTLASRLSYFLTTSMPDAALFDAAASGRLATKEGVEAEATRLLASPNARDALASLHLQWLGVDGIDDLAKDPKLFPGFTPALKTAMKDEVTDFADQVIRAGDGALATLLTAASTPARGPLLTLYGVTTAPATAGLVALPPAERAGLLTQPAFLATHAHPNQTSPVLRGVAIRRHVLCLPMPDPPANVNNTPPEPRADASTRERLAEHEKSPSCGACHGLIDPIGLTFEGYDAIGARRRTDEGGRAIDPSATISGTMTLDGPVSDAVALAHALAGSEEVRSCVGRQWIRFALGRNEGDADACAVDRVLADFRASGQRIPALVRAIVTSDLFRKRVVQP